jgi:hypothetical protein
MMVERVYRGFLALYPKAFRREYGEAMIDTFRDLYQDRRARRFGRRSPLGFWLFLVADLSRSLVREQIAACRSGGRLEALRWLGVCAAGSIVTVCLANTTTWLFGYLYHPYLEGMTIAPWIYGAFLGLGLGIAERAALGRHGRLGVRWVVASGVGAAIGLQIAASVASITGPVGYGVVLGAFVGSSQWLVLRTRVARAGWWVLGSAGALSLGVLSYAASLDRTLRGLNPLPHGLLAGQAEVSYREAIGVLVRGLYGPRSWAELAMELAVMATSGLVIGALTARPVSALLSRPR